MTQPFENAIWPVQHPRIKKPPICTEELGLTMNCSMTRSKKFRCLYVSLPRTPYMLGPKIIYSPGGLPWRKKGYVSHKQNFGPWSRTKYMKKWYRSRIRWSKMASVVVFTPLKITSMNDKIKSTVGRKIPCGRTNIWKFPGTSAPTFSLSCCKQ